MADLLPSTPTLPNSSPPAGSLNNTLDLSELPPIFVSATHFETEDLHVLEEQLVDSGAALTYDLIEARIVLSKVTRKPRILFDLKAKGLWTEEVKQTRDSSTEDEVTASSQPLAKKSKVEPVSGSKAKVSEAIVIDDSSTASEGEDPVQNKVRSGKREAVERARSPRPKTVNVPVEALIRVVKLDWFRKSLESGTPLPLDGFVTYQGRQVSKPESTAAPASSHVTPKKSTNASIRSSDRASSPIAAIMERAKEDAPSQSIRTGPLRQTQIRTNRSILYQHKLGSRLQHKTTSRTSSPHDHIRARLGCLKRSAGNAGVGHCRY